MLRAPNREKIDLVGSVGLHKEEYMWGSSASWSDYFDIILRSLHVVGMRWSHPKERSWQLLVLGEMRIHQELVRMQSHFLSLTHGSEQNEGVPFQGVRFEQGRSGQVGEVDVFHIFETDNERERRQLAARSANGRKQQVHSSQSCGTMEKHQEIHQLR